MVALACAMVGGILYVLLYFVIPGMGIHGLPAGKGSMRLLAPLTLLFASICYASCFEDQPRQSAWLHLAAGIVGGAACVFVLHALPAATPVSLPAVALGTVIGAVLAVAGLSGFVARGL